jgi:hypothetical protein
MHTKAITKISSLPQQAGNVLEKGRTIANLQALVVSAQEVTDLLLKVDTHDNN